MILQYDLLSYQYGCIYHGFIGKVCKLDKPMFFSVILFFPWDPWSLLWGKKKDYNTILYHWIITNTVSGMFTSWHQSRHLSHVIFKTHQLFKRALTCGYDDQLKWIMSPQTQNLFCGYEFPLLLLTLLLKGTTYVQMATAKETLELEFSGWFVSNGSKYHHHRNKRFYFSLAERI